MMLYPPMADLVDKVGSRYLLVNLVARRAREISATADPDDVNFEKKPVSCAIDEVYTGKLKIGDIIDSFAGTSDNEYSF